VALTLVAGAKSLSLYFLQTVDFAYVMRLFGVTIGLFVMNSMLLSILNGLQEIRTYIVVNIQQSALTLVLTVALIVSFDLEGALIALVTNQSLVLFFLLWRLRGHLIIRSTSFRAAFDRVEAVRLSKFALMGSVSAIAQPLTSIAVRDHITGSIGQVEAGYWQAIWYISSVYLTVVTMTLSVYFLPKLSATHEKVKLRRELLAGYAIIMPTVMVFAFGVYLSRDLLIRIVFTEEFAPMVELFRWMLIGDVIKLASWLVAYLMLAKAMTKSFVVTEVIFSASLVFLSIVMTDNYGLVGVTYAHTLNYTMYLFAVAILTQRFWR
jgi:PST family polysaccharide transporter